MSLSPPANKVAGSENILPCLLDRISAQTPAEEGRGSSYSVVRSYQQAVMRDLRWLLNTRAHLDSAEAEEFPEVKRSVLNFGCRDFCGQTVSSLSAADIERDLIEAIRCFEPRILRNTLTVKAVPARDGVGLNVVAFEIRAEVWAPPMPEHVVIRTELDLETGQYDLR